MVDQWRLPGRILIKDTIETRRSTLDKRCIQYYRERKKKKEKKRKFPFYPNLYFALAQFFSRFLLTLSPILHGIKWIICQLKLNIIRLCYSH